MADVDKQVTIRLEAKDDLTPAFRAAAREADTLAKKLDKAGNTRTFGQAVRSGLSSMTGGMRDTAGEAGRLERAITGAGRATDRAFKGSDRALTPLAGRLNDAADAADKVRDKYQGMADAGTKMLAVGAGMAVGIGAVVKQYADFDKAMSSVQANTGATGANLEALRDRAIELGGATQYSGEEAAKGINELAKAGVSTSAILDGGLKGALSLAAAGQMEVADAAELAASTMTQFGLSGTAVPHVADLLAAAANKAQGSVHDMGLALNQVGLVAHSTGISVEDTVTTLTAFASAGMLGSDAGTSFKTMLQRLSPASEEVATAMDILGLSAYDSAGNFVGMAEYAGRLQAALGGLSVEQRTATMNMIFGADAVRAANILYLEGEAGIRRWRQELEMAGFAQKNAAALTNNLAGDWERFGGAVDTVVLRSGTGLNDFLRGVVKNATSAVDAFGKIPGPILEVGLGLGAAGTAAMLMGGAFLAAVPNVMAGYTALTTAAAGGNLASASLLGVARAAGIVGVAFAGAFAAAKAAEWGGSMMVAKQSSDELSKSLVALGSGSAAADAGLSKLMSTATWDVLGQNPRNAAEALDALGASAKRVLNPTVWNRVDFMGQARTTGEFNEQVRQLDGAFAQMVREGKIDEAKAAFDRVMGAVKAQGGDVEKTSALFSQYTAAVQEGADASHKLSQEQQLAEAAALGMSDAEYKTASSAEKAAKATQSFKDKVEGLGSALLGQRDAERGFQAAIDDVTTSIQQNGTSLDVHTEKGRANQAALDAVASSGAKAAAEIYNQTGSIEATAAKVDETRTAFLRAAGQFNMNSEQAKLLADQLGLTTEDVMQLAQMLPSASGNINIGVNMLGFPEANAALQNIQDQMHFEPAVLQAPVMGDFIKGIATAQGISDRLAASQPQVTVSQKGAEKTQDALKATTSEAQTTGAQKPNVRVTQTGARQAQQEFGKATSDAKELGAQRPNPRVTVSGTETSSAKVESLLDKLRSLGSRVWQGFVALTQRTVPNADGGVYPNADGNLYATIRAFASGGFENHRAQIAPAGAWRLWAEPETGGEAYIPLAASKRARSTAILEEVARRFGMSVVKFAQGGINAYAGGGVTVPVAAAAGANATSGSGKNAVINVTARVVAVEMMPGVKAPFLYTPNGPWDTSTRRPDMNVTGISKRFNDRYVSKAELLEFAQKNYEAQTRLTEVTAKAAASSSSGGGGYGSGNRGAKGSAYSKAPANIRKLIDKYAKQYNVSPELIAAVIQAESGFNPKARSPKGAMGLMQLMPATARQLGVRDPYNAEQNIMGGVKYLAELLRMFGGDIRKALAAYNAGPGRVKSSRPLPKVTQKYVRDITSDPGVHADGTPVEASGSGMSASKTASGGSAAVGGSLAGGALSKQAAAKKTGAAAASAANNLVISMIGEARKAVGTWYKWGGGHGGNNERKQLGKTLVDCSGLVNLALSKALKTNVDRSTKDWMRGGKYIRHMTVQDALNTAGAVVVRNGHMALSVGDGKHIIEAPQTGKKVRQRTTKAREWTKGAWDTRLGTPGRGAVSGGGGGVDPKTMREATQNAAQAAKAYQDALKAYNTPAYIHLAAATKEQNTFSRQFLANLRKIRDRGYPQVAFRLLQMGEEEAAVLAASLADAPLKVLRQQRQMFDENAKLTDQQKDLEEELGRVGGPAAWITASKQARSTSGKSKEFAHYVQKIGATDPILAQQIAAMGLEEGYDLARTIAALPANSVQRRAVRKDLVTDPSDTRALVAWTGKRFDNARWMTFLGNIDRIRARGFATLANAFLDMGVDQAYDLAARAAKSTDRDLRGMRGNFVDEPKRLGEQQKALEEKVLGPAWQQARTAITKRMAGSAKFMADLERLRANGYADLARRYYDMGEEAAGAEAASMVAATDAERKQMQSLYAKSDAADKKWSALGDLLHGVGKVLDVAIGVATNSDPMVRWTAPMPVDARPTQAQYASSSSLQAARAGRGPLLHVENMYATDPADAGSKLETRLGDAVSVSGLDRMVV